MRRSLNILWLLITIPIFINAAFMALNDPDSSTAAGKVAFAFGYGAIQSLLVLGILAVIDWCIDRIAGKRTGGAVGADRPPELPRT